jgi:sarcosine oxidase subunit gamma
MSDAKSALPGARYEGFVKLREMGLQGMITLRGDLASAKLAAAVQTATGTAVPGQRQIVTEGDRAAAWMSPDELLLLVPYAEVTDIIAGIETALAGEHFLAVNVSDARAMFRLEGALCRDAMAKLSPVDFSEAAFCPGDFRRSRMAQIAAAMWMPDGQSLQVICFRSVAQYAFDLLSAAAAPGSEPRLYG